MLGRSQAYKRNQYHNSRRSGAISLSVNRRHTGTIICSVDHRRTSAIIWSVDRRRISAISIVIAGIAALSVCRWYVAVQCQRRVGSVGRSARSLVTGLVRRHISARSYRVHRRIGMRLVGLCSYAYRHEACRGNVLDRDLER